MGESGEKEVEEKGEDKHVLTEGVKEAGGVPGRKKKMKIVMDDSDSDWILTLTCITFSTFTFYFYDFD